MDELKSVSLRQVSRVEEEPVEPPKTEEKDLVLLVGKIRPESTLTLTGWVGLEFGGFETFSSGTRERPT